MRAAGHRCLLARHRFGTINTGLFFGFNDLDVEGTWVWASGAPVNFTAWRFGEPNNCCGGEDFGELGQDYQWNDVTPQHRWRGVVEVEATPVPEPASMLLVGTGAAGLISKARRRRKQR